MEAIPKNLLTLQLEMLRLKMKRSLQLYFMLIPALLGCALTACNSDDTWGTDPQDYSGTAVTAFSLKADKSVLANLDSVYFSIDLINADIFNAQPMPKGTDVSAIAVKISSDVCSVARLTFIDDDNKQQTVDYLNDADAKINFAHGPVTFHIESADGTAQRDYKILLNVATEKTDSLYWDEMQSGLIKGIDRMAATKTVKVGDKALMLSVDNQGGCEITTFVPAPRTGGGTWESTLLTPVFNENCSLSAAEVESFTATESGILYLKGDNGTLFKSEDGGVTFIAVDRDWKSITAPYKEGVLGVKQQNGTSVYASYPEGMIKANISVSADFPVQGVSGAASLSTMWALNPQVTVCGGVTSTGKVTGATWAFDGNRWAKISDKLPARRGYSMTRYTICETDTTNWNVVEREVLLAFGGFDPDAEEAVADKTVYVSRDMGVNWQEGSELLQLPVYLPFTSGASLIVFDKTLGANPVRPMAVTPVTTWNCPYLYLFGGFNLDGSVNETYWSGVVNHLRVKPLQ